MTDQIRETDSPGGDLEDNVLLCAVALQLSLIEGRQAYEAMRSWLGAVDQDFVRLLRQQSTLTQADVDEIERCCDRLRRRI